MVMKYYSVGELAKELGYSRHAVYKLIKRGVLRTERLGAWVAIVKEDGDRAIELVRRAKRGSRPFYGLGAGFKRVKQIPKKK